MADDRFDRDGNRIENPIPGSPHPDPAMPSDSERAAARDAEMKRDFYEGKERSYVTNATSNTMGAWFLEYNAGRVPSQFWTKQEQQALLDRERER